MRALGLVAALILALASACSTDDEPAATTGQTTSPTGATSQADPNGPRLDELVSIADGRSLHATCWGTGSPMVIFLHGLIMPSDGAVWAHRPDLQSRIAPHTTYCEYERTNVGTSSTAPGPIPIERSAADLNDLLDGLKVKDPVVVLAGSHGGLIGTAFAAKYPNRVAGVVLLDPELPDAENTLDSLVPKQYRLTANSWRASQEKSDSYSGGPAVARQLDKLPKVPAVMFVPRDPEYPPGTKAKRFKAHLLWLQNDLLGRFQPGQLVKVDAGHDLAGHEDRIAAAVLKIVDAG